MELLTQLMAVSSRFEKERLLRGISDLDARTFIYAYDPAAVYHQKFSDDDIDMECLGEPTEELFHYLNDILDNDRRGQQVRNEVELFAIAYGDLIKLIMNKDLRCGVTATTFNKIANTKIPQFKVQLAKEVEISKMQFPCLAQIKYDGVRLITVHKDHKVKFFTRNGKQVNLPILKEQLEGFKVTNWVLDGEVVLQEGVQKGRTTVSGLINSAIHGGIIDESELTYFIFDGMHLANWEASKCLDIYKVRLELVKLIFDIIGGHTYMQLAHTVEMENAQDTETFYEGVLAMGYEGLILKHLSHLYTFKRSADWVKVKETKHADLVCKLVTSGEGKYNDKIGALFCSGEVEGHKITVSVGSGLTDEDRNQDFNFYIDKTIEVKYNSIIQDSNTKRWSLFLPRFERIRFDK